MSRRRQLASALSVATVAAVATLQLWPGLSNGLSPPISWDHGSHLGKAMLTAEELLPFSLRGWTDLVECGVPLGTLYTPIGTMWILLFRAFTPFLAWHQSYALAFLGFRTLVGLSALRLARAAGASAFGATCAGLLALADYGDHSEGGWFYDVEYGVWPMSIAMCFFCLALADTIVFVEKGQRGVGARAALLLGVALFSHQMALVAFGLVVPCLVVARRLGGGRGSLREDLARVLPVALIAGAIASWWMLPMLSMSAWIEDHGQLYQGTLEMGARIASGELVLDRSGGPNHWTNVLVSIGLLYGIFHRGPPRTLALGALVAMLFASSGWFFALDASRYLPALGRLIYPRVMMATKPMLFALAGVVISALWARLAPMVRAQLRTPSGRLGLVVTALALVPFTPEMPGRLETALLTRNVATTASGSAWDHWQAAWQWIAEQPDDGFWRVAYLSESTHLPQAAGAYTGRPLHITGALVGESFRNNTDSTHPTALRAMNVRYVVTEGAPGGELASEVTRITTFGPLVLSELEGWSGSLADGVDGGEPHVLALERTRVVVDPGGATTLVVRRAVAPGWVATADGVEVPIGEERVFDSPRLRLMRLEVPAGTERVELVYRSFRAPHLLGMLATLLGLLAVALWAGGWSRLPEARRVPVVTAFQKARARVPAWLERAWPALVVLLPFAGLFLLAGWNARGTHLPPRLSAASGSIARDDGTTTPCTRRDDGALLCGEVTVEATQVAIDGVYHSCLSAHPPRGGALVLRWDDLPLGSTLRVGGGVDDQAFLRRGAPIAVRARVDGEEVASLSVPVSHEWVDTTVPVPSGAHDVELEVRASEPSRRWLCLDAVSR